MKITYEQARKDHEYLWSICPAYDMTGGYVDQEDLEKLLKSPTKATARDCYCHQIKYWFEVGTEDDHDKHLPWRRHCNNYPDIIEIGIRHGILDDEDFD